MINYANEKIEFKGCPGCAYAKHEFELPCGMVYENENFTLSQDWELPIPGFFIVSPTRCIDKFEELSIEEKTEMFEIVDKTIKILRNNNVCDRFDVIFEEKENIHFHVWIMPRYKWMGDLVGGITKNIGQIFEYAKNTMRTEENYKKINEITNLVKENFKKEKNTTNDINLLPLRMIRIAKDLKMEQMSEFFGVTTAYISAIEKGIRKMNTKTLEIGLNNLGISLEEYNNLEKFKEYIEILPLEDQNKFKFMLIKTLGVVYPNLKENTEELINNYLYNNIKKKY